MKVRKLLFDHDYDFDLMGVSSSTKDFKLAWSINKVMKLGLKKAEDHCIRKASGEKVLIANYIFETDHGTFRLFKNRAVEGPLNSHAYIVPEFPHFDYIILIKGIVNGHDHDTASMMEALKRVRFLEYITHIDIKKLKSKENFLF